MKKLYTSALALMFISGAVVAQNGGHAAAPTKKSWNPEARRGTPPAANADRAILWSDDFSNPATWAIGHDGTLDLDWVIGTDVPSGGVPIAGIESTTASNGFGLVDSDLFNNQTTTYEQSHMTTVAPIDLTGFPNVILEFQTFYRKWTDEECYVVVQTTNTNWPVLDPTTDISMMPNVYRVFPGMATQAPVDNPTTVRINISASAGGQSQVYVRFYWSGIYGYAWMVDDVNISEQYQHDARMFDGYTSHIGDGTEYGRIPSTQIGSSMTVGGFVENLGSDALSNVVLTCEVRNDQTTALVITSTASTASLAPGDTLFMENVETLPTLDIGTYTATYTATSDQQASEEDLTNNTWLRYFEITENTFSLDNIGNYPAGEELLAATGTNSFTGGEDGLMLFTQYSLLAPQTVYGIQFLLANGTVEGGTVTGAVHDTTDVLADVVDAPLGTTAEYTISASDLASGVVTIPFSSPIALSAGAYYAGIELYSNANANDTRVLDDVTVPQPGMASAIYLAGDAVYSNGTAYAIRLLFNNDVNVAEVNSLVGINMYPNPSNGLVTINASITDKYTVEVMNVLGEVVHTDNFNMNLNMDLNGLAKGVYTVRVSTPTAAAVQRVTLN
jgi:hypothetical protein